MKGGKIKSGYNLDRSLNDALDPHVFILFHFANFATMLQLVSLVLLYHPSSIVYVIRKRYIFWGVSRCPIFPLVAGKKTLVTLGFCLSRLETL